MGILQKKQTGSATPATRFAEAVAVTRSRASTLRRRGATVAAGALAICMGYAIVFGHNGLTAYKHKRQDAAQLQQQAQDLERENSRLRDHVDRLQTDPSAIEHQARESFHYTRPGEVIYTLPPDPITPTPKR